MDVLDGITLALADNALPPAVARLIAEAGHEIRDLRGELAGCYHVSQDAKTAMDRAVLLSMVDEARDEVARLREEMREGRDDLNVLRNKYTIAKRVAEQLRDSSRESESLENIVDDPQVRQKIADAVRRGKKIEAIKALREYTQSRREDLGWGLRECKEYVEKYLCSL